jgi:hypothetical protein
MKRIYSIYAPGLAPRDPKQPLEPVEIASCSSSAAENVGCVYAVSSRRCYCSRSQSASG